MAGNLAWQSCLQPAFNRLGDLSSPYFGQSLSLAGFGPFDSPSTYNRKIDLQLRFTF